MQQNAAFENILHDVHELETFLHGVISFLARRRRCGASTKTRQQKRSRERGALRGVMVKAVPNAC
jgi:hypothetical protein